jgi:hypothetical protein
MAMYGKSILAAAMSVIASFFCVPAVAQSYFGDRDDNNVTVEVKTYYMNKNDYSSGVCEFRPVRSYKNYYSVLGDRLLVCRPGDYIYLRPIGTSAAKCSGYYIVRCEKYISQYQKYKIPFKKGDSDTDIVFEMRVEKPYNMAKPLLVTVELYFNDDCCE